MANTPKPKDLPFWELLTESQQNRLKGSYQLKRLYRRETLFTTKNQSHSVCFLIEGRVKVCRYFGDFREIILDVIPSGTFVSFQPIVDTPDEIEYGETVLASLMIHIDAHLLKDFMTENARFSAFVFQQLANRYNKVVSRLSLVHPSVRIRQQVVKLILEMANEYGRPVGHETVIEHGLSQQEMATMIHRSRQSVTGAMRLLKQEDLINYTRTEILVRDIDLLAKWGNSKT